MNISDLHKTQKTKEVTPAKGPAKAEDPNAQSDKTNKRTVNADSAGRNEPDEVGVQHIEVCETFDDMALKDDLLRGIYAYGFQKPSIIQQRAIMPVVKGKDTIAQAQSGFGKTATFCIAMLQTVKPGWGTQALIMAPTRELASQIHSVLAALGQFIEALQTKGCVGGTSVQEDIRALKAGVDIVVGTPGRCFDMIRRNALLLDELKTLVLDEADEMLDRGFQEQVYSIFEYVPNNVQCCLFSATMPERVLKLTTFMRDPIRILLKKEDVTLAGIRQYYVDVEKEHWKFDVLCDLYETMDIQSAIIFVNKRETADWLADRMRQEEHSVSVIHAGVPQEQRTNVMRRFRAGHARVLIASDLLARGIDVAQVSLVINYDFPKPHQKESYIHRIGRSGRYGKKGTAINFVTQRDAYSMRTVEQFYSTQIEELPQDIADILE